MMFATLSRDAIEWMQKLWSSFHTAEVLPEKVMVFLPHGKILSDDFEARLSLSDGTSAANYLKNLCFLCHIASMFSTAWLQAVISFPRGSYVSRSQTSLSSSRGFSQEPQNPVEKPNMFVRLVPLLTTRGMLSPLALFQCVSFPPKLSVHALFLLV